MKKQRYKYLPPQDAGTVNKSNTFYVVIGCSFGISNSLTSQQSVTEIAVDDNAGNLLDRVALAAVTQIADPATSSTAVLICLPRHMLVPPGCKVQNNATGKIMMVSCADTTELDGKDSLENALAIL